MVSTKSDRPSVTRVYQNHHLDSTRWEVYEPRARDIVVTTAYKSGTTWTQDIFYHLLYGKLAEMPARESVTPWPDAHFIPIEKAQLGQWLGSLEGQRIVKSHLPLDGLPFFDDVFYVVVCRDPRDVFMSFFNHYSRYTDEAYAMMNAPEKLVGNPLPICPEDPRELWTPWISSGWFDWESEGYPFWSNLHHTQTYWDYRHLPNILFMHYNDMLEDLGDAVKTLADFTGIETDEQDIARVVEATTFANVKKKFAADEGEDPMALTFKGGRDGFFFQGSNGRWRDVLNDDDLALYEEAMQRVCEPDCAAYLERGKRALKRG